MNEGAILRNNLIIGFSSAYEETLRSFINDLD